MPEQLVTLSAEANNQNKNTALLIGIDTGKEQCLFIFTHVSNKINHNVLNDKQGGIGIGTPTRPDYPYQIQSMGKKNRLCIYVTMGVSALALYAALGVFFKF